MNVPLRFVNRLIRRTSRTSNNSIRLPSVQQYKTTRYSCQRQLATQTNTNNQNTAQKPLTPPTKQKSATTPQSDSVDYIVDVSGNNISTVLSSTVPVVIDTWADWCEPCKILMPRLDKLARQCNGAFILAKLNVDDPNNAPLLKQLPVQNIPTVFGVVQGNIVTSFTGNIDDTQLTQFFDTLFGRPLKQVIADANVLDSNATEQLSEAQLQYNNAQFLIELNQNNKASEIYNTIIKNAATDPGSEQLLVKATVGLAQCVLNEANNTTDMETKQSLIQSVLQLLDDLKQSALKNKSIAKQLNDPLYTDMIAKLTTMNDLSKLGNKSLTELQAEVEADPKNAEKLHNLALYLYSIGQLDDAIQYCLQSIRYDKQGAARKLILKLMEQLGPTHPTTIITRRKLSNILY